MAVIAVRTSCARHSIDFGGPRLVADLITHDPVDGAKLDEPMIALSIPAGELVATAAQVEAIQAFLTEITHAATILGMVAQKPATLPERIVERLVPRSA
jgi:hypothetical protein